MRVGIWSRVFLPTCLLVSANAFAVGCSSNSTDHHGGAGYPSAGGSAGGTTSAGSAGAAATETERASGSYAKARCLRYQECIPFSFDVTYASLADCEAITARYCPLEVDAAGSSSNASALVACAAARMAQTCGDWLTALPACAARALLGGPCAPHGIASPPS